MKDNIYPISKTNMASESRNGYKITTILTRGGRPRITLDKLVKKCRKTVEKMLPFLMKAAGGHIRVQGIRGSVSKMMSKTGKTADTIIKMGMKIRNTNGEKRKGDNNSNRAIGITQGKKSRKKITQDTISIFKARREGNTKRKIPFVYSL